MGREFSRNEPPADLFEFKIPLSNSAKEQTVIVTILTDMGREIQTLEQRVNKTR